MFYVIYFTFNENILNSNCDRFNNLLLCLFYEVSFEEKKKHETIFHIKL